MVPGAVQVTTSEPLPFLSSNGAATSTSVLAIQSGVPVVAALEHATYAMGAVTTIHDAITNGAFQDRRLYDVTTGLDYLVQFATALLETSVNTIRADGDEA